MRKYVVILFMLCSCNIFRKTTSKTITLDGSKSHAAPGQKLTHVQWRDINGNAVIENPNSLVTKAIVTQPTTFELFGQQTDGLSAKDSMNVNY